MLTASNIYIRYGDRVLFNHVNVVIRNKDKVGLVGRNGAGKSTLLKIMANEITPMEGSVTRPSDTTFALLHQEIEIDQAKEVLEESMTAFSDLQALNHKIDQINVEISERTDYESESYMALLDQFSDLNEKYVLMGGDNAEGEAVKVLKGLGFQEKDFHRKISEFSGGWQMRVVLAKMLLRKPDYLLLDEPTNHLDIESIIWLEKFLKGYPGAIIIISHDQEFLDNCTKRIIEIELGKIQDHSGNYSQYVIQKEDRRQKQIASFENQQRVIAQKERTITRFMAKASKTRMAQSMKKQLDKMERVEIDQQDTSGMNIRFPPAPRSGEIAIEAINVSKAYGALEVLDNISLKVERKDRIAFVGQNGQGKTTLAKILINKLEHTSGEVNLGFNISVGYYAQNQAETLDRKKTLLQTMEDHSPPEMRTKLRNILGAFLFSGEDAEKKVSVLSGGERARLALACMLLRPFNLLVLDEPTNHLDIISKEILKSALKKYDGTLILVSHDRHFLAGLTDKTIEFRDKQLFEYLGDVNYFLEKRELDSLRAVEQSAKKPKTQKPNKPLNSSHAPSHKTLTRKIESLERKISTLEKQIKQLENSMAEEGFYTKEDSGGVLEEYNAKKDELTSLYERWEYYHEQLELQSKIQ